MRSVSVLLAAMLPMAAVAEQNTQTASWDYEQLRGSLRVSEIIGSDVQANDGSEYGEVKDVVLTSDGRIASLLVDADDAALQRDATAGAREERVDYAAEDDDASVRVEEDRVEYEADRRDRAAVEVDEADRRDQAAVEVEAEGEAQDDARVFTDDERVGEVVTEDRDRQDRHDPTVQDDTNYMARDDMSRLPADAETADEGASARDDARVVSASTREDGLVELQWQNASFDAEQNLVRLDVNQQASQVSNVSVEGGAAQPAGGQGELRASELIGMDVNLSDEESFGEVEDVLVNADGSATALVIDSWNFLTKDRYAIPAELNNVNLEENQIDYQLSSEEVEGFGEFEFDEYLETN